MKPQAHVVGRARVRRRPPGASPTARRPRSPRTAGSGRPTRRPRRRTTRTSSTVPASTRATYGLALRGRVLHRHPLHAIDEPSFPPRAPARAGRPSSPGQVVERPRLDPVDQLTRLSLGGNGIGPAAAPGGHRLEIEDAAGRHVRPAEITKKPAVELKLFESGLDGMEVEHGPIPHGQETGFRASAIGLGRTVHDNQQKGSGPAERGGAVRNVERARGFASGVFLLILAVLGLMAWSRSEADEDQPPPLKPGLIVTYRDDNSRSRTST